MANGKFVAYYRVSTAGQGRSGLGLEGQQAAVRDWLNGGHWTLVEEVTEIESGKRGDRPELERARAICRAHKATLVIAKLDRLSRDAHFLLGLQKAGVRFVAVDMPDANEMTIGIMAVVAQAEAAMISTRTKVALAASKARRKAENLPPLGGARPGAADRARQVAARGTAALQAKADARAADLAPLVAAWRAAGITSQNGIAQALNAAGIQTARGRTWTNVQAAALLRRLDGVAA